MKLKLKLFRHCEREAKQPKLDYNLNLDCRVAYAPRNDIIRLSILALLIAFAVPAFADEGYLEHIKHHSTLSSMVTANGDQNPYALVVAPVTAGTVQKDDVLIDNFNDISNLQGLGTTIVDYNPATGQVKEFAHIDRHLPACPGGVGLSTAMAMLQSGYVVVGSTPSNNGTTSTKGNGCLMILDSNGKLVKTIAGPDIDDPWGNMAVIDNGTTATLFVSMAGFDVTPPTVIDPATDKPPIINKATILRIDLATPAGKAAGGQRARRWSPAGFRNAPIRTSS